MYQQRLAKLRTVFQKEGIDGLLVTNFYNILYLSGFAGLSPDEREAYLLVTRDAVYFFTDGRYFTKNLKSQMSNLKSTPRLITFDKSIVIHLQELARKKSIKTIGFEAEDVKYSEYQSFRRELSNVRLQPTKQLIQQLRRMKDEEEIACIKKACELADQCLREIKNCVHVGVSEKEIAYKLEFWVRKQGYQLAFEPIVAVDVNSAVVHYNTATGNGVIRKNSVVIIDFGIKYNNYVSDITRMFFIGEPSSEVQKTYEKLLDAQQKTIEQLNNEKGAQQVDLYCRETLKRHGLPDYPHSTGHALGLQIHETPRISFRSTDTLHDHHVFTIEPGVYYEGKWGMRIEDTILLRNGKPEILTKFPKALFVL